MANYREILCLTLLLGLYCCPVEAVKIYKTHNLDKPARVSVQSLNTEFLLPLRQSELTLIPNCEPARPGQGRKEFQEYYTTVYKTLAPVWKAPTDPTSMPVLLLTIEPSGLIKKVTILKSSGHTELDQESVDMITAMNQFPALPPVFSQSLQLVVTYDQVSMQAQLWPKEKIHATRKVIWNMAPNWMQESIGIITSKWHKIDYLASHHVGVVMTVDSQTGEILHRSIQHSSCYEEIDQIVLKSN